MGFNLVFLKLAFFPPEDWSSPINAAEPPDLLPPQELGLPEWNCPAPTEPQLPTHTLPQV